MGAARCGVNILVQYCVYYDTQSALLHSLVNSRQSPLPFCFLLTGFRRPTHSATSTYIGSEFSATYVGNGGVSAHHHTVKAVLDHGFGRALDSAQQLRSSRFESPPVPRRPSLLWF